MRLLILLICLGLACYTSTKLYRMAQVREWVPGARVESVTITSKWTSYSRGSTLYQIGWGSSDLPELSAEHLNIPEERWQQLNEGDTVEILHLGKSMEPYLRHDAIWANDGNFQFDICLLLVWLGIGGYQVFRMVRHQDY